MKSFEDDGLLFKMVETRVRRSLARTADLAHPKNADVRHCLRRAIAEHGIEARSADQVAGLEQAYQRGWLHAEMITEELTLYSFPSPLYHRFAYPYTCGLLGTAYIVP